MIAREVVKRALHFDYPPYVPLCDCREESDIIQLGSKALVPESTSPRVEGSDLLPVGVDGIMATREERAAGVRDEWGAVWRSLDNSSGWVIHFPLKEKFDLEAISVPDPHDPRRFELARQRLTELPEGMYILGSRSSSLFERMFYLRSPEELFCDMVTDPVKVGDLADLVLRHTLGLIEEWHSLGVDGIFIGDDWGSQQGTLISPSLWRRIFQPRYAKLVEASHTRGMDIFLHSCGDIFDLIPDMIDCGFDAINTHQPCLMGIDRLAETYGGKVTLITSPDIQTTMAFGSPEDVEEESLHILRAFSPYHGGLIGHGHYTWDTPVENADAMVRAFRSWKPPYAV